MSGKMREFEIAAGQVMSFAPEATTLQNSLDRLHDQQRQQLKILQVLNDNHFDLDFTTRAGNRLVKQCTQEDLKPNLAEEEIMTPTSLAKLNTMLCEKTNNMLQMKLNTEHANVEEKKYIASESTVADRYASGLFGIQTTDTIPKNETPVVTNRYFRDLNTEHGDERRDNYVSDTIRRDPEREEVHIPSDVDPRHKLNLLPLLSALSSAIDNCTSQHQIEFVMWEQAWKKMVALVSKTIHSTAITIAAYQNKFQLLQAKLKDSEDRLSDMKEKMESIQIRDDKDNSREEEDTLYRRQISQLRPLLKRLQETACNAQRKVVDIGRSKNESVTGHSENDTKVLKAVHTLNKIINLYKTQTKLDSNATALYDTAKGEVDSVDDIETASELVLLLFEQQQQQMMIMKNVIWKMRTENKGI